MADNTKTLLLGSCFSTNIGEKMRQNGFDVLINPFGTIFNPASIIASIHRLQNPEPFTQDDCVMMGSGAGLWCSLSHYTRFAREGREEFLDNANRALESAAEYYRDCDRIIITFGTAWCFRHLQTPESDPLLKALFPGRARIVSNCLKLPAREFSHELLSVDAITAMYKDFVADCGKRIIFTVSPIRHLSDGAHANQLSKSALLLSIDGIIRGAGAAASERRAFYFPSYEIMLDDLRDYSWYAEDKVHPSPEAVDRIWDHFSEFPGLL